MATASQRKNTLVIKAAKRDTVSVSLVGKIYQVRAPKASMLIALANSTAADGETDVQGTIEALNNIVSAMFTKKDAEDVQNRLNDPEDDLDITHISETANKVINHFGGDNPSM